MTTKILIVNLGSMPVTVIQHDPNSYCKYDERTLQPREFSSHISGQRITVVEEMPEKAP